MSQWKVHRRHFLTGSGAVFVLPLLESLFPKTAASATVNDPKRFVSLYMPNGTYNRKGDAPWYPPVGALSASTLPLVLQPFQANLGDFSVLCSPGTSARDAADHKMFSTLGRGGGHVSAITTWLTQQVYADPGSSQCTVPGSSLDQMYAQATNKPAMTLCGGCPGGRPDNTPFDYGIFVSFKNGQAVQPEMNPVNLYKTMFANLVPTPGPTAPPPAAVRNKSILDLARSDISDLQSKLGKTDKLKLDDYFTSLRDLETRLTASVPPPTNGQCSPIPSPPSSLDNTDQYGNEQNYVQRIQAFFDMVTLAFKCDLTRSVSFMYDGETGARHLNNQVPANLVDANVSLTAEMHIGISHYLQNTNGREKCITRDRLYMMLMVYLLNGLKAGKDPSGSTILDNTLIYAGHCVADGSHDGGGSAGIPVLIGGGKNLVHPGNSYDMSGADLKDVLFTLSSKLGMGLPNFAGSSRLLAI